MLEESALVKLHLLSSAMFKRDLGASFRFKNRLAT